MRTLLRPLWPLFKPAVSWHYSFGPDPEIDFCLWILERDGLRVPPYDRHPESDGTLQAAGLDAHEWEAWFSRVVRATGGQWQTRMDRRHRWPQRAPQPAALWAGAPSVGIRIAEMADEYEDIFNERQGDKLAWHKSFEAVSDTLWKDLAPYRRGLPPVRVVTVDYPGLLHTVLPPDTIVLSTGGWQPKPSELATAILTGMRDLHATRS